MQILKTFSLIVFIFTGVSSLLSCESKKTEVVSSGVSQIQKSIFDLTCGAGSISIRQSQSTAVSTGVTSLKEGDHVQISGTVADATPCYNGSVSFSCSARVVIGQNRSFICDSGHVAGSTSLVPSSGVHNTPQTPLTVPTRAPTTTPSVVPSARSFVSGEFHTFGNGQQASGHIAVGSSSPLVPYATCKIGFVCN